MFVDPENSCNQMCGARGHMDGVSFPLRARRRIRYLPRLLGSREYREAMETDAMP